MTEERTEPLPSGPDEPRPEIPNVELIEEIGRGGMGVVYRGRQPMIDRPVAVKLVHSELSSPDFEKRFVREARILARLNHPNIVTCFDAGTTAARDCYLVMELMEGPDLQGHLEENGALPLPLALRVTRNIAEALRYAFEKGGGIIHRDVKPQNVLLQQESTPDGGARFVVKLADLGLARPLEAGEADMDLTTTGSSMGTPATMAPEQYDAPRNVDHRTDIYGLGCVLYHCLTGQRAFPQRTQSELFARKAQVSGPDPRTLRREVPKPVADLVMSMLSSKQGKRPQDYGSLLERLDCLIDGCEKGAPSRAKLVIRLAALLVVGTGGWMLWRAGTRSPEDPDRGTARARELPTNDPPKEVQEPDDGTPPEDPGNETVAKLDEQALGPARDESISAEPLETAPPASSETGEPERSDTGGDDHDLESTEREDEQRLEDESTTNEPTADGVVEEPDPVEIARPWPEPPQGVAEGKEIDLDAESPFHWKVLGVYVNDKVFDAGEHLPLGDCQKPFSAPNLHTNYTLKLEVSDGTDSKCHDVAVTASDDPPQCSGIVEPKDGTPIGPGSVLPITLAPVSDPDLNQPAPEAAWTVRSASDENLDDWLDLEADSAPVLRVPDEVTLSSPSITVEADFGGGCRPTVKLEFDGRHRIRAGEKELALLGAGTPEVNKPGTGEGWDEAEPVRVPRLGELRQYSDAALSEWTFIQPVDKQDDRWRVQGRRGVDDKDHEGGVRWSDLPAGPWSLKAVLRPHDLEPPAKRDEIGIRWNAADGRSINFDPDHYERDLHVRVMVDAEGSATCQWRLPPDGWSESQKLGSDPSSAKLEFFAIGRTELQIQSLTVFGADSAE